LRKLLFPIMALILALALALSLAVPALGQSASAWTVKRDYAPDWGKSLPMAQSASVWTDKPDYSPEEVVTISGSGFLANTKVAVTVERPNGVTDTVAPTPVTNDTGHFTCSYQLDGITGTYIVTATDGTNTATTTFTDVPQTWSVSVSPSSASVAQGGSTNATVTVTTNKPGNPPDVDLSATGQPAGVTFSFSPSSGRANFTSNMTVSVGLTVTPGTYPITIRVTTGIGTSESVKATTNFTLTVTGGGSTVNTTLVLNSVVPSSVVVGSSGPVTFTATLTRDDTTAAVAGATINFTVDGSYVGSASTNAGGVAAFSTYNPSGLSAGSHTVQASFAGNSTFNPSTSGTLTLNVTVNTTLVLNSVVPSSVVLGSSGPVTFTATLTNNTGAAVAGATIDFKVDGSSVGSASTNATGVATFSTYNPSGLSAGSHPVQASFAGQNIGGITFNPSTSGTLTLNVTVNTTLVLNSVVPSSVVVGSSGPVTFTATLTNNTSAAVAGATINFTVDGSSVGSGTTNATGVATFSTYNPSGLSAGSHPVQAFFAGQDIGGITFNPSTSGTLTLNVTVNTTLVLNSVVPSSVVVGSSGPVTFTATLTNNTGAAVAGATINFTVDGSYVGSGTTNATGVATFSTYDPSGLSAGNHPVQASFAGQDIGGITFNPSTSGTLTLRVTGGGPIVNTTLVLNSVVPNSVVVGSSGPVTFTATLTNNTGAAVAGATINFTVDGSYAGSGTTNATGVATFSTYDPSGLSAGSHPVQASFAGQDIGGITFNPSTSGTLTLNVTVNTTLVLNSVVPSSVVVGSSGPVTFTATLTNNTGAAVAGATINFTVDGSYVGSGTTNATGVATLGYNPSGLSAGSHPVQAFFAGQNIGGITFNPSTSGTLTLNVTVNTTLVLNSVVPSSVVVGSSGPVTFTATLTNNTGAAVAGATINFTVDGSYVGSGTTNATGVATLGYNPSGLSAGSHPVQASFAGQDIGGITFNPSTSGTLPLMVRGEGTPVNTTLVLNSVVPSSVVVGSSGPVTFTATLTRDDTTAGVVGATINFTVNGSYVGSSSTGAGGVATLNYDPSGLSVGSYTVQASFAGEDIGGTTFNTSTSGTLPLNVITPQPMPFRPSLNNQSPYSGARYLPNLRWLNHAGY
jgi:hypothetical protein